MPKAISNTSPLLYLYRIGAINLLPKMFDEVWTAESVKNELLAGRLSMCAAVTIISNIPQNLAELRFHIQKEIYQLALFGAFIVKQVGLGQKK